MPSFLSRSTIRVKSACILNCILVMIIMTIITMTNIQLKIFICIYFWLSICFADQLVLSLSAWSYDVTYCHKRFLLIFFFISVAATAEIYWPLKTRINTTCVIICNTITGTCVCNLNKYHMCNYVTWELKQLCQLMLKSYKHRMISSTSCSFVKNHLSLILGVGTDMLQWLQ